MKLNNKGMSIIEVVLTFALVMSLTVSMFTIVMNYRTKATFSIKKTDLETFKNTLTYDIESDIQKLGLKEINYEGECESLTDLSQCINLVFQDDTHKSFGISKIIADNKDSIINKYLYYDGIKYKLKDELPDNIPVGRSPIEFQTIQIDNDEILSSDTVYLEDGTIVTIYSIDVNVSHIDLDGDYGIHITATNDYKVR